MLPDALLKEYADKFYGFGTWNAKIWFIGIEEAGGWREQDVQKRLDAWKQNCRLELEDAPTFYRASGNHRWHGNGAESQDTWRKLILMLLVARGQDAEEPAILNYQRTRWGATAGNTCLAELLPLPSPNSAAWNYRDWSKLPWLKNRSSYQNHVLLERAVSIQRKIDEFRPKVVVFSASTWHRIWAAIARGVWTQAITGKLMGLDRDGMSFYVTRQPRAESDEYFRKIGAFLKRKHGYQD